MQNVAEEALPRSLNETQITAEIALWSRLKMDDITLEKGIQKVRLSWREEGKLEGGVGGA